MGLHPDRVDRAVGAATVGQVDERLGDVVHRSRSTVSTPSAGEVEPLGDAVDADHPAPGVGAIRAVSWPTGPSPKTASVPPSGTSANSNACHAVGRMSDR